MKRATELEEKAAYTALSPRKERAFLSEVEELCELMERVEALELSDDPFSMLNGNCVDPKESVYALTAGRRINKWLVLYAVDYQEQYIVALRIEIDKASKYE